MCILEHMDTLNKIILRTGTDDLIAMLLVGTSSFIWLSGGDIPETLGVLTTTIIGFFFGKKYTEQGIQTGITAINPALAAPYIAEEDEGK